MACHSFCRINPMLPGVKSLLGLGLRYAIKMPRPANNYIKTVDRFTDDVRRIAFFKFNPPEDRDDGELRYIPQLYLKNEMWEPPVCEKCPEIEDCLGDFKKELLRRQRHYMQRPTPSNLTIGQWSLARRLRTNDDYIVIEADKNLGGCFGDLHIYTAKGVEEHLGNRDVYQPLTREEVDERQAQLKSAIYDFTVRWREAKVMSLAEDNYLNEAIHRFDGKLARFRMSLKAHKTPWKMRPIVCCVGTFMNALSRWLDYWLQKLKPFIPTYIKDSDSLLDELDALGDLPSNARLGTADANAMYTNICTDHAIEVIFEWLDSLTLPADFPLEAVKEAIELVMRNNIFEWGDMYFLQLLGTAMGTSAACMWATIYFAVHETRKLLPDYKPSLLFMKRFIDDIFLIWIGDDAEYKCFQVDTNNFGILTWDFGGGLSDSVDFLDLTISIDNGKISTKTFQKDLNLYQYIMPTSAHPPWMMPGIIYSLMKKYKRQNTYEHDYNDMAVKLFKRHVARGWDRATMKRYILDADERLRRPKPPTTNLAPSVPSTDNKDRLFLHMEYHPNDIPRRHVRAIYDDICKDTFEKRLGIKQLTIAYSRPRNVKDLLTRAKLHQAPGKPVSKYYSGELSIN